jgi:hypothetical protein
MAFGRDKKGEEPQQTEDFAAATDAEWAQPADARAIGADEEAPPPADAAPVADVPPPEEPAGSDVGAVAASSAAAANAQTSTWAATPAVSSSSSSEPKSIAESLPVGSELAQERPEVLVGAAFAGAFIFARILKHVTSE